jgi:hypothetical protein
LWHPEHAACNGGRRFPATANALSAMRVEVFDRVGITAHEDVSGTDGVDQQVLKYRERGSR